MLINIDFKEIIEAVIDTITFGINEEINVDDLIDNTPQEYEKIIHTIGEELIKFDWEKWEKEVSE